MALRLKALALTGLLFLSHLGHLGAQNMEADACQHDATPAEDSLEAYLESIILANARAPGYLRGSEVLVYRVDGVNIAVGFARYRGSGVFERALAINACVQSFPMKGEYEDSRGDTQIWNDVVGKLDLEIDELEAVYLAILYRRLVNGHWIDLETEAQNDNGGLVHPDVLPGSDRWTVTLKHDPPFHEDKYDIVVQLSRSGEVLLDP